MKKCVLLIIVSVFCLFFTLSSPAFQDGELGKVDLNRKIAAVNGVEIKVKDFKWAFSSEMIRLVTTIGYLNPEQERDLKKKTFEQLINRELLYQESHRKGIEISPMDVETAYKKARSEMLAPVDHKRIQDTLDLSVSDIKEEFRRAYAAQRLVDQTVKIDPIALDEDINAFFERNRDQFKVEGRVKVSHILMEVPKDAPPAQKAMTRSDMEMVKQRLNEGEAFEEMAKQYSSSFDRVNGGNIGFIEKGRSDANFEKAAYSLKPGQISDIVETSYGFHILKVTEREPDAMLSLSDIREDVKKLMMADRESKAVMNFINTLRAKAKIEVFADPLEIQ
jgi:peptidyl-prolyl cis-trans isomerase C